MDYITNVELNSTFFQGMTNLKALKQRAKNTLKLMCFMLAAYMTITEILRYFENNDASSIGFQRFNERPEDK